MSKPRLNQSQKIAANTDGKNIIVSASAGTGKTTLLIERIIRLITEKYYGVDDLLVMSFTRAAAEELKVKLADRLRQAITDHPEKTQFLQQQLAKLPLASICTIDSFCLDVVKKYGYILDVDPALADNVMDNSQIELFKERAMNITLSDLGQYHDLVSVMCARVEDISPLQDAIYYLSSFMNNLEDEDKWIQQVMDTYSQMQNNVINEDLDRYISRHLLISLQKSLNSYYRLYHLYTDYFTDAMVPVHQDNLNLYRQGQQLLEEGNYIDAGLLCETISTISFPRLSGKKDFTDEQKQADSLIGRNKTIFKEGLKEISSFSQSVFCHQGQQAAQYVRQLLQLTREYRNNLRELKAEAAVMDYSDMEHYAVEILKAKGGIIADEYRSRFREIMVDEYQDSSQPQENLVRLICRENNVFRVGDIKQSIYGFRNAKPELMKSLIRNQGENDLIVSLNENYRSKANILEMSNHIFTELMNVNDKNTFVQQDNFKPGAAGQYEDTIPVRITRLDADDSYSRRQKNIMLAQHVATLIRDMHDRENLSYNNFVILIRNNKNKPLLKDALTALNIPAHVSYDEGFFTDPAVSTVISLLKLIQDPNDNFSVIDVLRGPIFSFSDEQIARLQIEYPELSWFEKAGRSQPYNRLNELVNDLKDKAEDIPVTDLITEIFRYDDWYFNNITASSRENLDQLYNMVIDFSRKNTTVSNLIEYFQLQQRVEKAEASSTSEKDDVVRVMTIHHSKGLQFRYLFFIDFSNDITASKEKGLIADEQLGISMKNISLPYRVEHQNLYYDVMKTKKKLEALDEELRLLYVAITRAEKYLNIIYCPDKENSFEEMNLYSLINSENTYVPWILSALKNYGSDYVMEKVQLTGFTPVSKPQDDRSYQFTRYSYQQSEAEQYTPSSTESVRMMPLDYNIKPGALRGTLMHKTVETLGLREVSEDEIKGLSREDTRIMMNFYRHPFTRELSGYQVYHELPFICRLENGFVNGIIDLLVESDQEVYLIDFKSDRYVDAEILQQRYHSQLEAYYRVVRSSYPDRPVSTWIYSFYLNDYVRIEM